MLEFFAGCARLFNDTFYAAVDLEYFAFLAYYIIIMIGFGMFFLFYRGLKKM